MPVVKCTVCKTKFYVKPSHLVLGYGKYCSRKCQAKGQLKGKFVFCHICGKKIWRMPKEIRCSKSGKFFCSKSCQTQWRNRYFSGIRHPNWKNGEHQEYRGLLFRSKRKIKCAYCGIRDSRVLVVHHLDNNRANNKIRNLIWLCLNCHYLIHNHNLKIK